jgi:murein DD-endopeptidase MepM/ murein hydrolase activator NlpD
MFCFGMALTYSPQMFISRIRIAIVCTALAAAAILIVFPRYQDLERESIASASSGVPAAPRFLTTKGTISPHATLVSTLVDSEIPAPLANDVAALIRPVFDVRKIHQGNPFQIDRELDGVLRDFQYKIDDERILKVSKTESGYDAEVQTLQLDSRTNFIDAEIHNSLFAALDGFPKGESLAESLAAIFAWDVDFNVDIQKGAKIRLVVDAQFHDNAFVKYGSIQAAELVNAGKSYRAYRFNDEYFDEKGNAVKRAFLSSPLKVMRVTSGFTYHRMHPILGTERPHLAIDYGAPEGTAAFAVANGTVIFAGPNGDLGNFVQIRHGNGLTTGYGHLSRIAAGVAVGRAVKQDEIVGYVGHTGLATGPHLHYMMTKGGTPINPSSIKAEPPKQMEAGMKPQYVAHIAALKQELDSGEQLAKK